MFIAVIAKALGRKQVVGNNQLVVELYHPCLAGSGSSSTTLPAIPKNFVVQVALPVHKFLLKSKKARDRIEAELKKQASSVIWPESPTGEICLHCTLAPDITNLKKRSLKSWEPTCHKIIEDHIGKNISAADVKIPSESWAPAVQKMKEIVFHADDLCVEMDEGKHLVHLAGIREAVAKYQNFIQLLLEDIVLELAKDKSRVVESLKAFKPYHIKLLKNAKEIASSRDLELLFDEKEVTLQGVQQEVIQMKVMMYEMMNNVVSKTASFDQIRANLIKTGSAAKYFQRYFEQKGLNITWESAGKEVTMHAFSSKDIEIAFARMNEDMAQKKVGLSSDCLLTLTLPQWEEKKKKLSDDFEVLDITVLDDNSAIMVTSTKDSVDKIADDVETFIQKFTRMEQMITLREGEVKFLEKYMSPEIYGIEQKLAAEAVSFEILSKGLKCGVIVRGTNQGLIGGVNEIRDLVRAILEVVHDCNIPGIQRYFTTKRGRDSLGALEMRKKVVILISREKERKSSAVTPDSAKNMFPAVKTGPTVKSEVTTLQGTLIRVMKGDLTECQVDCLIIDIREDFTYTRGAAEIVLKKG